MKTSRVKQQSTKWYELRKGSIGGTRFGQVISNRKNKLVYELLDEMLSEFSLEDQFTNDDMQFGIDNEPYARDIYSKQTGIKFTTVGLVFSDHSKIHHASPDGLNRKQGIVLEVKCTRNGSTHIKRYFEGIDSEYIPQIVNYFAVSNDIKEVHWVSYCPFRSERPIVVYKFTRETEIPDGKSTSTIDEMAKEGISKIKQIEKQLKELEQKFKF